MQKIIKEAPKITSKTRLLNFPWWIVIIILIGIGIFFSIVGNDIYQDAFRWIAPGVVLTLQVTIISYVLAVQSGRASCWERV